MASPVPRKRGFQPGAPNAQERERAPHAALEPLKVLESLPAVCTVDDMCRVFRVGPSQFHRRERRGEFQRFELPRVRVTEPKRWSGARLVRYLTGETFSIAVKRSA